MEREQLTPVVRTTLTADIYRKLMGQIIRGAWSPGEKIPPERQLCLQLGAGRASLREALKALEIMGMIEIRLGDGTYVCKRSEFLSRPLLWAITSSSGTDIHELVEARRLIESELAALAADRASGDDLKEIGVHLDRMEISQESPSDFLESDIEFHLAIGRAAHNSILLNALLLIRNLLQEWIGSALRMQGVPGKAMEHHKAIFIAIAKRNPLAARTAMQIHLEEMAQSYLEARSAALNEASQSAAASQPEVDTTNQPA